MLASCETVSNLADKVSPSDEPSDTDNQLLSDELGRDPTLEEILADAEMDFEETDFVNDDQLEIAEENFLLTPLQNMIPPWLTVMTALIQLKKKR